MKAAELKYFERLKEQVVNKMKQLHPEIPTMIADWNGDDFLTFQVELKEKLKEQISEKWFYTHMKNNSKKLPRIDTLNLLSKFAGYKNWNDFKYKYIHSSDHQIKQADRSDRLFIIVPGLVLIVTMLFYITVSAIYNKEYTFCFIDGETGESLTQQRINISVLVEGESPVYYKCDESGCFSIKHNTRTLSFAVDAPGFQPDTIVRRLNTFDRDEQIRLRPGLNPAR